MADIDRRTLVRGVLGCAAFVTVASVSIVTPEILKAVPLSAGNTGSLEADEKVETDDVVDIDGLIDVDDALPESAQRVQYWRRRRRAWWWRRHPWWWRRRRVVCYWRGGRRVCRRRW
jgi:hypothetical protein